MSGGATGRIATWLALGLGFSPVLLELGAHLAAEPAARYVLVFPWLLALAARHEGGRAAPSRWGYAWLAAGLAIEVVAFGGGMPKLARPGLPLVVIGLCRLQGLASLRTALLALWLIPIPFAVCALASPWLEELWVRAALVLVGGDLALEPSRVATLALAGPAGTTLIRAWDGGLPLMTLLAGIGWYTACRRAVPAVVGIRTAAVWAILGLPAQAAIVAAAVALLAAGARGAGELVLHHGFWAVAAAALFAAQRPIARAEGPEPASPGGPAVRSSARWEKA